VQELQKFSRMDPLFVGNVLQHSGWPNAMSAIMVAKEVFSKA
jgi:hypothetical protein